MDESYGARYADLYHRHWWWRAREEFIERVLDDRIAPQGAGDILDFGCGDGLLFPVLQKFGDPFGIETDASLLDPAGAWRSRIRSDPLRPDPAEAGRYGLIVALDVLEHIEHPASVVRELARRVRPGGLFVATVPAFQSMWTGHDTMNHHFKRYRLRELVQLVSDSGLKPIDARYFFAWLALAKWAVSIKERLTREDTTPPHVPRATVNQAMLALCRAEQRVLRRMPPPFGSSALIVARAP
jgi:SAM-dependent methyltransferase